MTQLFVLRGNMMKVRSNTPIVQRKGFVNSFRADSFLRHKVLYM